MAEIEILEKKLLKKIGKAIGDFSMIEDKDRIMVAISGGKDSWVMLHTLKMLQARAPVDFELVAVNIDQGYRGFRQDQIEEYVARLDVEFHMEFFDIASLIEEKSSDAIPCSLCSRLRRGSLYGLAEKYTCNKIALGHHQDDMIETLLLNAFFIGTLGSMAPKLKSEDGKNVVIRPLIYTSEKDIIEYTRAIGFPIVCCQCPLMCGADVHADHKRRMVKNLITDLEEKIPEIRNSLLASLSHVKTSHLLDRNLWKF